MNRHRQQCYALLQVVIATDTPFISQILPARLCDHRCTTDCVWKKSKKFFLERKKSKKFILRISIIEVSLAKFGRKMENSPNCTL